MRIKWCGTASLVIESGTTRILVDPFRGSVRSEDVRAETIFITHPHFDHFADVGAFLDGAKRVYVCETGVRRARENHIPDGKMIPFAANEKIGIGDITVRTFRSRHCKFDLATILSVALNPVTYLRYFRRGVELIKLTKKYKIGNDDIFALEFSAEGKKVMVLGSAGMDPDAEYPTGADLFVFPYQGRSGMHRYMVKFLEVFAPKRIMIDHHDNAFPPFTHAVRTKKFVPTVKKYLPDAEAFEPVLGKWYEI